jgi:VIT1/CCC1 family predicted Fe2+/Mn2+ transporter
VADVLKANPEQALRIHAQEELGVVPDELPSPWIAAGSSLGCFALGALIPLITYLAGVDRLWPALGVGGIGLFAAGAIVATFTGRRWWLSGFRQLVLGAAAAAVTYGIGRLIG